MKRRSLLLGAAAGLAAPTLLASTAPALGATRPPPSGGTTPPARRSPRPSTPRPNLAARFTTLPPQTQQVIVVGAASYTTSYATLEAYARIRGRWQPASAALPARIGSRARPIRVGPARRCGRRSRRTRTSR
ncbi:hypothetical protein AB0A95_15390 [Micromonospora sp. NPDC049230]|uniref:hypothetical protein n=1 Tax=Micromonospora sp. NPDC049230 TaxID=3155502 RepID=UPI00340F29C7